MAILIKGLALQKKGITELTIYYDGHVRYEQDDGQYIEMGDATAIEVEETKIGVVYPTESKMWVEAST